MSVVINEVLCYVQNNFDKFACVLLSTAMNGFFSDDKVSTVKQCLYMHAGKLDGIPMLIKRNPSDGKHKFQCDGVLNLYAFVDRHQCMLPTFDDNDFIAMAANQLDYKWQLNWIECFGGSERC